jgi:peptidoglycan hydrolase-like protein with peptidoglycan-binding domain
LTGTEIGIYGRRAVRVLAVVWLSLFMASEAPARAWAARQKTAPGAAARKSTSKKSASSSRRGRHRATTAASRSRGKTRRAATQLAPTPERYKEIQQALSEKGYSGGAVDGAWGPQWTDALKRFQKDQKIEGGGKLNSMSLIALGLGPKREGGVSAPPAPASETPKRELP